MHWTKSMPDLTTLYYRTKRWGTTQSTLNSEHGHRTGITVERVKGKGGTGSKHL